MKISIITPTRNQVQFIQQTLDSVATQNWPEIEHIVLDALSTDGTPDLLKACTHPIQFVSEKDRGQSDAINKGFRMATGEILAWLNSDDWYQDGTLEFVGRWFEEHPECHWLAGAVDNIFPDGTTRRVTPAYHGLEALLGRERYSLHQPGIFWRRSMFEKVGDLDINLSCSFDHDFWIRSVLNGFQPICVERPLACFRIHADSKTGRAMKASLEEDWELFCRHQGALDEKQRQSVSDALVRYEAGYFIANFYYLMENEGRSAALRYFFSRIRAGLKVRPFRLLLGALWRIPGGKAPAWSTRR